MEDKMAKLYDDKSSYAYYTLPKARLSDMIISNDKFLNMMRKHIIHQTKKYEGDAKYYNWLKGAYKQFKNDNKKTVMYLVKEFEMKKAATAYRRATTNKTGVISPLKLKDYKFSDDIFKRLTITPDAKNHGMIMLLDWSGSMCDSIKQTIEQLMNLVWFCDKVNIPYEVYLFTSEMDGKVNKYRYLDNGDKVKNTNNSYNFKHGDGVFEDFNLVNIASHKLKRKQLDESLLYLWHMAEYYNERYTYRGGYEDAYKGDRFSVPDCFCICIGV